MTTRIPLGPFVLTEHIASGGMGEVWGGHHAQSGLGIACKVITARYAKDPTYVDEFTREVRAVAALDHPGIIRVHDCGVLDQSTAAAAPAGELVEGSPYLVMERGDGTLKGLPEPLAWPDLRDTLMRLLDALAHAHARGIIHRDLKPANVLRMPDGAPNDVRLTDFGIAHARDSRDTTSGMTEDSSGTPQYMAPEQLRGLWRDYGPWTDLYSVGCLTWYLVCGAPPWRGDIFSLITAHISATPPAFTPEIMVPEALEAWVRVLLRKEPSSRFQCAADAAYALERIAGASVRGLPEVRQGRPTPSALQTLTFRFDDSGADTVVEAPAPLDALFFEPAPSGKAAKLDSEVPPIPAHWEPRTRRDASPPLAGAGLGLFGVRDHALVGRGAIQDTLWARLRSVHTSHAAQFILLRGEAGTGKTALLDWLCRRARELGSAEVWTARHRGDTGRYDGLRYAVGQALGSHGLHGAKLDRRLDLAIVKRGGLSLEETAALASFLDPTRGEEPNDADTARIATRVLEVSGQPRPIIVRLDDVHHGAATLRWVRHVLSNRPRIPVLFLACGRPTQLSAESVRSVLRQIEEFAAATTLDIPPLAPAAHAELVHSMLHLDGELADEIAARTEGNPMFAVQLVGDLVGRGVLAQRGGSFALQTGELELPDDIHALWQQRLRRTLERRPRGDRRAVELAAILGRRVPEVTWLALCTHAGVTPTPRLVSALCHEGVAVRTEDGWEFTHALSHQSALRAMADDARTAPAHRLCAQFLAQTRTADDPVVVGHLLLAGDYSACILALTACARAAFEQDRYADARAVLERTAELAATRPDLKGRNPLTALIALLLGIACAGEREFELASENLGGFTPTAGHAPVLQDLAFCTERAGGLAISAGQRALASTAYSLAQALWDSAGEPQKAQRIGIALSALGLEVG